MEFRQRVTFADATYRHRAVQAQEQLAFIGQANVVTGQGVVQHRHHLLRHARIQRHVGHQRVQAVLLRQLPEQIGQAGAGRHLAAKQLHAVARLTNHSSARSSSLSENAEVRKRTTR